MVLPPEIVGATGEDGGQRATTRYALLWRVTHVLSSTKPEALKTVVSSSSLQPKTSQSRVHPPFITPECVWAVALYLLVATPQSQPQAHLML